MQIFDKIFSLRNRLLFMLFVLYSNIILSMQLFFIIIDKHCIVLLPFFTIPLMIISSILFLIIVWVEKQFKILLLPKTICNNLLYKLLWIVFTISSVLWNGFCWGVLIFAVLL